MNFSKIFNIYPYTKGSQKVNGISLFSSTKMQVHIHLIIFKVGSFKTYTLAPSLLLLLETMLKVLLISSKVQLLFCFHCLLWFQNLLSWGRARNLMVLKMANRETDGGFGIFCERIISVTKGLRLTKSLKISPINTWIWCSFFQNLISN